jgi:hypothetical protein
MKTLICRDERNCCQTYQMGAAKRTSHDKDMSDNKAIKQTIRVLKKGDCHLFKL